MHEDKKLNKNDDNNNRLLVEIIISSCLWVGMWTAFQSPILPHNNNKTQLADFFFNFSSCVVLKLPSKKTGPDLYFFFRDFSISFFSRLRS